MCVKISYDIFRIKPNCGRCNHRFLQLKMISLERSLRHLAWSNQKVYTFFGQMPNEVFALSTAEGEWTIGQLLKHLAGSGEWYQYCLNGGRWTDLPEVTSGAVAIEYLPIMEKLDAVLLDNLSLPDDALEIEGENGIIHATRSLILSQAVMHAAEHKAEIAAIMRQHGHHLNLDELDVWSFVSETSGN